jgi:hypothetical protein
MLIYFFNVAAIISYSSFDLNGSYLSLKILRYLYFTG